MAAMPYLFRVFYAMSSYAKPAILGVGTAIAYATLSWVLMGSFELLAMAYAYAAVWWLVLMASLIWLNKAPVQLSVN